MESQFHVLNATRFDLFGRSAERRMERRLIADYEATIADLVDHLGPENHAVAVQIAEIPAGIRGFGHVKQRQLAAAKTSEAALLAAFRNSRPLAQAAE